MKSMKNIFLSVLFICSIAASAQIDRSTQPKPGPAPEININPDIEYYDVSQDYLNQFEASDYNKIKKRVMASVKKKVETSELPGNAQNRLLAELANIYVVTNTLGWTLQYNATPINSSQELKTLLD